MKETAAGYALRADRGPGGDLLLSLSGRVSLAESEGLLNEAVRLWEDARPPAVAIDLDGVSYLDSAGALTLWRLEERGRQQGVPFTLTRVPEGVRGIMGLIDRDQLQTPPLHAEAKKEHFLVNLGGVSLHMAQDFVALISFLGELVMVLTQLLARPRDLRWEEVLFTMRRAGADGLPIVGLISLLIGLIIAFMSSLQLKQFGANIFVAQLVAVAIVRELGPIMTAILVAGRSASAFAAEIGTMRVNDEVDALVTMGFDPVRFLAAPKVIATILVLPLLTLYADLFGILGGMIVGVTGLDLTPYTWLQASRRSIDAFTLVMSLVKSVVFAFIIAWIGCQRGFQVRGGVEAVGAATTSAVVTSILLIVVVDSAFAVVLHYIG